MYELLVEGVVIPGRYFDGMSAREAAERMSNDMRYAGKRISVNDPDDDELCAFRDGERCE